MNKAIGITGGIASGKSTVVDFLMSAGYEVVDADKLVRSLQAPGGQLHQAIFEHYGPDFFDEQNELIREKLGSRIFSDDKARAELGSLQGKIIRANLYRLAEEKVAEKLKDGLFFMDIPLLFEQNYDELFDEIWLVALPEGQQIERLMARNQLTEAEARQRIATQLPLEEKIKRATTVLDNSGSLEVLQRQVQTALEKARNAG
ncbi:dephospho-CoA kinase [Lactococcus termiticola]|uniref:Dephospho-CoA kinase n=1 Tax=Lactococcus termiticola TaxID=2169526 RepID=A0A2R5HJ60_9LACT|nr:dephospho-CoA kinase [Lactococcus termiticola]GBG96201.1 dephospho-CoA kinase [Lactococcus termiticola]